MRCRCCLVIVIEGHCLLVSARLSVMAAWQGYKEVHQWTCLRRNFSGSPSLRVQDSLLQEVLCHYRWGHEGGNDMVFHEDSCGKKCHCDLFPPLNDANQLVRNVIAHTLWPPCSNPYVTYVTSYTYFSGVSPTIVEVNGILL